MKPLGDRLLFRLPDAPERIGSLWVPPVAQGDYTLCQAEVEEVGEGVRDARLQPGLRVIVKRFGRVPLDQSGALWCGSEQDVLAILVLS